MKTLKINLDMSSYSRVIIACATLFIMVSFAQAQKSESSIQLSFSKKTDNSRIVSALVMAKNKAGKFLPAQNAHVNFYIKKDKEQVLITKTNTNGAGKTSANLPKELAMDDDRYFTVTVKVENDEILEDAEEELHLKDIHVTLNLNPTDTSRTATAVVTETASDGTEKPIKDIAINFYVQRLFGVMPAAEEHSVSTNEKGEASFVYPKGIPGDTLGKITAVAMIEDNDTYGTVEAKNECAWGKPLLLDKDPFPRALWGAHAKWPMIILLCCLYGGVWFCYFFMFYQLRKIKKEGESELLIKN
ncbi:MAG: hypothetical protein WCP52_03475 [Bacteroidota bacterium]